MERLLTKHKASQVNLTNHGLQRLIERLGEIPITEAITLLQDAFVLGKRPPRSFKKRSSKGQNFKYRYCWHKGFIFVFYKLNNDKKPYPDFFLVTIYIWDGEK